MAPVKVTIKTTSPNEFVVNIDSSKTVGELARLGADAYDKATSSTGTSFTHLLYHGEVMDAESKLSEYVSDEPECTVLATLAFTNPPAKESTLAQIQFDIPEPFIEPLIQMGFSRNSATKALLISHLNVNEALDWLLMHTDSPDLDVPLTVAEVSALLGIRIPESVTSGPTYDVRKTIAEMNKHHVCTASVTGNECYEQTYYLCFTCRPDTISVGCCEACKDVCHKGHQLSEPKHGRFFCDCGAGALCHPCKCFLNRKLARDIISPLVTDTMDLD